MSSLPRPLTPFTEERLSKFYTPTKRNHRSHNDMFYRNTKVKVHSPDGDTIYFDIAASVLQGDTLIQYLFIICLDYVLRTSINKIKENIIFVHRVKFQYLL